VPSSIKEEDVNFFCSLLGSMSLTDQLQPYEGRNVRDNGQGQCAHEAQGSMSGVTDHSCCKDRQT